MESSHIQESLELEVANFGPIVKANVNLRPLTVFIGPSNTGKSYLAILIYALHRHFSDSSIWPGRRRFRPSYRMFRHDTPQQLSEETVKALSELAERIFADKSLITEGIVLHGPVVDGIRSTLDARGVELGNEIGRCFGFDKAGVMIRKGRRDGAHIVLRRRFKNHSEPMEHKLNIRAKEIEFRTTIPEGSPIRIDTRNTEGVQIRRLRHAAEELISVGEPIEEVLSAHQLMEFIADLLQPLIIAPLHFPAFYLPADRTGVMHAHSVVVSALIESAAMTGLRPAARTPMLSGVLADFLDQLITLDQPRNWRSKGRQDFGTQIEKAILGGSVVRNRSESIGYPHFTYLPEKWKKNDALPLMNASSMVSELAPVVLYLRHMVTPDNVMIVEEPESHLHPAMQVEFTRQLALLVRSGIRVIVTTHSEWVLEELANIVRRSKLPKNLRKDNAGNDFSLRKDQVGAWLFQPRDRPEGSVVKEIGLDDSGTYPSGFDDVAAALHNDWAEITSRIGETE